MRAFMAAQVSLRTRISITDELILASATLLDYQLFYRFSTTLIMAASITTGAHDAAHESRSSRARLTDYRRRLPRAHKNIAPPRAADAATTLYAELDYDRSVDKIPPAASDDQYRRAAPRARPSITQHHCLITGAAPDAA
jgi:hypothetical protein